MHAQRVPLWPVGLLMVSMMSIQGGASLAKQLFPMVGASGATACRLIAGALLLLLVLRPWRKRPSARDWKLLTVYGVSLGVMNYLLYQSIDRIPLGIAVALEFTGPLAVATLKSHRAVDLLWVALALGGIVLLMPHDSLNGSLDPLGVAFALGAGACWGIYIWFGQKVGTDFGAEGVAIGVTIAALVIAPIGLAQSGFEGFSWSIVPLVAMVALLSTALPYALEIVALRHLPTTMFGTLMSLEPALAALSGLLFLAEFLTLVQWLAISAIMAASIGTTLTGRSRNKSWESAPVPD
ncbi:threonine/homoserine exporter RhtA [Larsenimonas salina]|uniref:threonine/homoserine exporter RhtA n=1 Tax=Larsenimonas salina TaxID=1295565 RepID=UPI0020743A97|nr:threonine/homoserine exporter RhtA [Larsenimonas salina]MCM5705154.1 threonine/homoserine exporter RhtA [Larsenimonas salina]